MQFEFNQEPMSNKWAITLLIGLVILFLLLFIFARGRTEKMRKLEQEMSPAVEQTLSFQPTGDASRRLSLFYFILRDDYPSAHIRANIRPALFIYLFPVCRHVWFAATKTIGPQ
jgi:hypothetical protein